MPRLLTYFDLENLILLWCSLLMEEERRPDHGVISIVSLVVSGFSD
jgi:hypothetical protein